MVSMSNIKNQLRAAGFRNKFWGWSAIQQLPAILDDDERIMRVASGMYEGGHAIILATNRRLLFMDKKPISFVVEDIPYDMVAEVQFRLNPFDATLTIYCHSKKIHIKSLSHARVRMFALHVEGQVKEVKRAMQMWSNASPYYQQQQQPGQQQMPAVPPAQQTRVY